MFKSNIVKCNIFVNIAVYSKKSAYKKLEYIKKKKKEYIT